MKIFVEFEDLNDHKLHVQWSSLATRDACRIYIHRESVNGMSPVDECIHLSKPMVDMLISGLEEWKYSAENE